jgi:hypothetical protein
MLFNNFQIPKPMIKNLLFSFFLVLVQFGISAQTTNTYTRSNGDWNTASNWSLNLVPSAAHDVVIPSGITVNISGNSFAKTVSISGILTINDGMRLTVYNDFTVNSTGSFKMPAGAGYATLVVYWSYYNNGVTDFWKSDVVIGGDLISPSTSALQQRGNIVVGGNIIGSFDTTGGSGAGQIYAVNPNATVTITPTSIDTNVPPGTAVPLSEGSTLITLVNTVIYDSGCSAFSITQPINSCSSVGGIAVYSATPSVAADSYLWEEFSNATSAWSIVVDGVKNSVNYSGATTGTLTISNLTAAMFGTSSNRYRVKITKGTCTIKSNYGFLYLNSVGGSASPVSTTVCSGINGTVLTLSGHSGSVVNWESSLDNFTTSGTTIANTTTTLTATNLTANTSYRAVIQNGAGCSSKSSIALIAVAKASTAPTSITGMLSVCSGSSTTLTAVGGILGTYGAYEWGTGSTIGSNVIAGATAVSITVTPSSSMSYWVRRKDAPTCVAATTGGIVTAVTVNALPTIPTITASGSVNFCVGGSVTLTSSAGTSYLWSTGATTASISPTIAGSYSVIVTNASGCSSLSSLATVVTVSTLPVTPTFVITNIDCNNPTGSVTLNNLPTGNWVINPGNISGSGTSFAINGLTVVGSPYFYTVTNSNGCSSASTASISIIDNNLSTTWNGVSWSNGLPDVNKKIIFSGNFSSTSDLTGCSCLVTGGNVIINSTHTFTVTNEVTVSGGNLIFKCDLDSPLNNSASLVQINNVSSNNNTGAIKYERMTNTVIRNTDYTYWSSPVYPQILVNLSPNTLADKYFSYEVTASSEDWKQEPPASIMAVGKGYIIRGPENTSPPSPPSLFLATFKGVPNNGHYAITDIHPYKSYLIGNPYPSALNADKFLLDNASVLDGTLYFWTHNTNIGVSTVNLGSGAYAYTSDDYASYNLTGGVGTDGVPYPKGGVAASFGAIPNGIIAAGQGFFASSKETITGPNEIVFNNDMRLNGSLGNNSQFFKIASKSSSSVEKNRIWLGFSNSQGAFKQTLVGYVTGATNDYDGRYDGETFDGNQFVDFYSLNQDKKLVIQGRSLPFEETDKVPLGYKTTIKGSFTITINQKDGLFATQNIFIEDKLLNVIHDLNQSSYNFTTEVGNFNDRFVLRYTNKTLGTQSFDKSEKIVMVSNKNKQITINSSGERIDKVQIYDLLGKTIYQKGNILATDFVTSTLVTNHQALLIKITLQNGAILTRKIMN